MPIFESMWIRHLVAIKTCCRAHTQGPPEWGWESAVMLVGEAGPVYGMTHESSTRITTGIEAQANPETNTIVATISKSIIGGDLATSRFLIVVGSQDGYGEGKARLSMKRPLHGSLEAARQRIRLTCRNTTQPSGMCFYQKAWIKRPC